MGDSKEEVARERAVVDYDPELGWNFPERSGWPPFDVIGAEDALILMFARGDLIPLWAKDHGGRQTIGIYVACSDVFAWGCADCEPAPVIGYGDEDDSVFGELYEECRKSVWGAARWCCFRRNQRPQGPVEVRMRAEGAWCERMEALPPRPTP